MSNDQHTSLTMAHIDNDQGLIKIKLMHKLREIETLHEMTSLVNSDGRFEFCLKRLEKYLDLLHKALFLKEYQDELYKAGEVMNLDRLIINTAIQRTTTDKLQYTESYLKNTGLTYTSVMYSKLTKFHALLDQIFQIGYLPEKQTFMSQQTVNDNGNPTLV